MRLRPATEADVQAIAAVERAAAHDPWSLGAIEGSLALPTTLAFVAEADAVCGHLLGSVVADEAEILIVAVHPSQQRQGLGRRLLDHAQQAWRSRGVSRAFLEVRADNTPALGLYRAMGWEEAGVRRRYYADGTDALALVWSPA